MQDLIHLLSLIIWMHPPNARHGMLLNHLLRFPQENGIIVKSVLVYNDEIMK